MYDEQVKRLRDLQSITEHCGEQSCGECENRELCDKYDNKTLSGIYKDTADAIEELQNKLSFSVETGKALCHTAHKLLDEVPRWIPVTERLPEAGERVLCYCRANIYEVMKMRTDGDWVYDTNHVYMHSFVTHWMPLPQPPKEE